MLGRLTPAGVHSSYCTEEAEEAARVNDKIKKLYNIMKQISNKSQRQTTTPVKDMNGKTLTTLEEQLSRWTEYFSTLLNREEPRNPPRFENNASELDIDTNIPTRAEIREAIKKFKKPQNTRL